MEIGAAVFIIAMAAVWGIGYLLRKSKEKMRGGWGYQFDVKKQTERESRYGDS